jgi:hypothetical protein
MKDTITDDLFEHKTYPARPGHVFGSDTSRAAAKSVASSSGALRNQICEHIRIWGDRGRTCDELEVHYGRHQTVSARVRELVLADRIHDSGRRRQTRSGRGARVYVFGPKP